VVTFEQESPLAELLVRWTGRTSAAWIVGAAYDHDDAYDAPGP
jgi:hypothetical protein